MNGSVPDRSTLTPEGSASQASTFNEQFLSGVISIQSPAFDSGV